MPQQQADTLVVPKRWPLVNQLETRTEGVPLSKDARLINCVAEFNPNYEEFEIYKRIGIAPQSTYNAGSAQTARGIFTVAPTGIVAYVFGTSLFYGSTQTGTVLDTSINQSYFFEVMNGFPLKLVFGNCAHSYVMAIPALTITDITASMNTGSPGAGIPNNWVPGFVYLDGTLYIMDPLGNIWNSTPGNNDPTTWNALGVIPASSNADLGVALAKHLNFVVALKQYTTQIFYDNGANNAPPASPLSPVPDAQLPYGCAASWSVQSIDNTLIWITSNKTASPQIVAMDNLVPRIISTPSIDRILDDYAFGTGQALYNQAGINTWVLKHFGHRLYGLTILALNITIVIDIDQKLPYIWTDPLGNAWPIQDMAFIPPGLSVTGQLLTGQKGIHLAQHMTNGGIYQIDNAVAFPNDLGVPFPVDIYTPNYDAGTVRNKTLNALYPIADKAPGSIIQVRYSDDDYQSWSNWRYCDLNTKKPRMMKWGTFEKRRAFHIRHQCNTDYRIRAMDMQLAFGTR